MAFVLDGTNIKRPNAIEENNSTQLAENRTLQGDITRDYFGDNKKIWTLSYTNCNVDDYNTINTIYQSYLTSATAKSWQVTETNYTISSTTVHVDLAERGFKTKGSSYLSDFTLVLREA